MLPLLTLTPFLTLTLTQVLSNPLPHRMPATTLHNDISTERDYDVGLTNVASQRAHDVHASASIRMADTGDVWSCATSDGYM